MPAIPRWILLEVGRLAADRAKTELLLVHFEGGWEVLRRHRERVHLLLSRTGDGVRSRNQQHDVSTAKTLPILHAIKRHFTRLHVSASAAWNQVNTLKTN